MKTAKLITVLILAIGAPTTFAAGTDSVTIRVKGTIKPVACTVDLGYGAGVAATVDFGDIEATSLNVDPNSPTHILTNGFGLHVACGADTHVGLVFSNTANTVTPGLQHHVHGQPLTTVTKFGEFGLGDAKAGSYVMSLTHPEATNNAGTEVAAQWSNYDVAAKIHVKPIAVNPTGSMVEVLVPSADGSIGLGVTSNGTTPVLVKDFRANLSVNPTIAPKNTLGTGAGIELNGSATVSIIYL